MNLWFFGWMLILVQKLVSMIKHLLFNTAVGGNTTSFDRDVEDICIALEQVIDRRQIFNKVVIL